MRRALSLAPLLALVAGAPLAAQEPPRREGSVRAEARVERVVVDAHVTDSRGDPISGLRPVDFRVKVDGNPVPLESAEWIPADSPEVPPTESAASPSEASAGKEYPPGRLLIFFFQTNYERSRLVGLMRMSLQAKRFLDTLLPTDLVAVLSFDSHLKLRQDFTNDRERIRGAIYDAIRTGLTPRPEPGTGPSLARNFDFRAAKRAVTPEKALALISRAAAPIPGGKSMLYFGWGLGTIGGLAGPNPRDVRDYAEALPALAAARINIFTLDVTDADYHTLEVTLERISELTGGTYQKAHIFPSLAIDRVRRAIAGRYVLVFKKPDGPRGAHSIEVKLANRKGRVIARAYYED